nr:MAG TPA: hypothetical protein [Siphoviridae sp. ctD5s5]
MIYLIINPILIYVPDKGIIIKTFHYFSPLRIE